MAFRRFRLSCVLGGPPGGRTFAATIPAGDRPAPRVGDIFEVGPTRYAVYRVGDPGPGGVVAVDCFPDPWGQSPPMTRMIDDLLAVGFAERGPITPGHPA